MSWRFVEDATHADDLTEGDLCWITQYVCVFLEEGREPPLPPNITMVIRENDLFIVLEAKCDIRILHPTLGVGIISPTTEVRRLVGREYMGHG